MQNTDMQRKIKQSNTQAMKLVDVDTVTVDIIENALKNAREEMDAVLFRTAMSPGIREQGDCFPMIANKDGKMVVGQFGSFIHGFMDAFEGELEEGDIVLTNDPYMTNAAVSHLSHGRPCLVICLTTAAWCRAQFQLKRRVFIKKA
jgi:N-methylhydantoinase B